MTARQMRGAERRRGSSCRACDRVTVCLQTCLPPLCPIGPCSFHSPGYAYLVPIQFVVYPHPTTVFLPECATKSATEVQHRCAALPRME